MLLIDCKTELDLSWSKECIIPEISTTPKIASNPPTPARQTTAATFKINNAKLYVPVVTLSINNNIKFLENMKQGFNRKKSWNKYRSETRTQTKNSNLDCLTDATFRNINRLFALSFKNGDNYPIRNSFDKYYMALVEIKGFNALINNKPFV